ncbi:MAG: hypothetical protein ACPG32_04900 [Akkermansiaceae bacterium]
MQNLRVIMVLLDKNRQKFPQELDVKTPCSLQIHYFKASIHVGDIWALNAFGWAGLQDGVMHALPVRSNPLPPW